jgi:hypothetical protein
MPSGERVSEPFFSAGGPNPGCGVWVPQKHEVRASPAQLPSVMFPGGPDTGSGVWVPQVHEGPASPVYRPSVMSLGDPPASSDLSTHDKGLAQLRGAARSVLPPSLQRFSIGRAFAALRNLARHVFSASR